MRREIGQPNAHFDTTSDRHQASEVEERVGHSGAHNTHTVAVRLAT